MKKISLILLFVGISNMLFSQTWVKVVCGTQFTVALRSDSTLWSWGSNGNGQLGIGNLVQQKSPVQIGADHDWKDISAGSCHCNAIKTDGTLWGWGLNNHGQIGDSTIIQRNSPVQIGADNNWAITGSAVVHSYAIKTNGTLWSWGYNIFGALGDSTLVEKHYPAQVGDDSNWKNVSGGVGHTLGVKTDGTLWSWGFNANGQIGDSTTVNSLVPKQICPGANWIDVSAGYEFSLALKSDSTLWSWGFNGNGQLGNGTISQSLIPAQVGSDHDWVKIAAGSGYSFGIKSDSTLFGWGANYYGCLGSEDATTTNPDPVKIGIGKNWNSISAAKGFPSGSVVIGFHSLGLKSQGTVICSTGWNANGQLGDSTIIDKSQFQCVTGELAASIVSTDFTQSESLVYPNPTNGYVHISNAENSEISVYNLLGEIMIDSKKITAADGVDLSGLPNGNYLVKIMNHNNMTLKKVALIK